jgi:hypothetical protein
MIKIRQKRAGRDSAQSKEAPFPPTLVRFNVSLFQPALLVTTGGLEAALAHFRAVVACRDTAKALEVILSGLCDEQYLFEFFYGGALFVLLLSAPSDAQIVNEQVSRFINNALLENRPKSPLEYNKSSCPSATLLVHFRKSLQSHVSRAAIEGIDVVQQALKLITELDIGALNDTTNVQAMSVDKYGRKKQGAAKQSRKIQQRREAAQNTHVKLENLLRIPIDTDAAAFEKLGNTLLERQQAILHVRVFVSHTDGVLIVVTCRTSWRILILQMLMPDGKSCTLATPRQWTQA